MKPEKKETPPAPVVKAKSIIVKPVEEDKSEMDLLPSALHDLLLEEPDELVEDEGEPTVFSYSQIAKKKAEKSSIEQVKVTSPRKQEELEPLCPFGLQGTCRFKENCK